MTSKEEAIARASRLKTQLEKRGVPTIVSLLQGRPGTPNNLWYDTRFIGSMGHHIVSTRSQGLTPGYQLVRQGRTDVPGPLANAYLGFDGIARIICMGWANHPGAGGPYTLPGGTIPKDNARPYMFGWEIEGGITQTDWPASFRIIMGKCFAATLAFLGRDERSHIEHKHWAPTRKIDRLGYTLTSARAELKPWLTYTEDEVSVEDVKTGMMEILELAFEASTLPDEQRTPTGRAARKYLRTILNGADVPSPQAVLETDDIVPAPGSALTVGTNPFWEAKSHLVNTTEAVKYQIPATLATIQQGIAAILARDPADVDEQALAVALAAILPQMNTQVILDAITALPAAVRLEIKDAL